MTKRYVLTGGLLAVMTVVAVFFALRAADAGLTPPPAGATTKWPKNEHGVTYGSSGLATSHEDEPELVLVVATNGEDGYCYRTELEGPEPSSPAAAVAQQKARGDRPIVIPVYEVDGVTRIGSFVSTHDPRLTFEVR